MTTSSPAHIAPLSPSSATSRASITSSSPSTPFILALDEGTTNAKACAIAPDGHILASGSCHVSITYPRPGWVEQDADAVWNAQLTAIQRCLESLSQSHPGQHTTPEAITISNQRETVVAWDAHTGQALTPMIGWQDSRTAEFCDWLRSPDREFLVSDTTGLSLDPMFSAPKMRYLLDHISAQVAAGQARIGTVDSWLVSRLTAQRSYVMEAGNASRTLLMDLSRLSWSPNMCELFGIDAAILPDIAPSNALMGTTRGLEMIADGVPIVAVLGDSHAALFGHGCRNSSSGKATFGTGSSVMIPCGAQPSPRSGMSTTLAWLTEEPMYGWEGNIVASGAAMDWMCRILGLAGGRELDELASGVPDSNGVVLVPAFSGLGAPWWDRQAVGLLSGVTAGASRAHMARAAVESVAHQIADVVEALDASSLTTLYADGGASASRLLMQTQADILGREVAVSAQREVSIMGAAFMGFARLGWSIPPISDADILRYRPCLPESERALRRRAWAQALRRARLDADTREEAVAG